MTSLSLSCSIHIPPLFSTLIYFSSTTHRKASGSFLSQFRRGRNPPIIVYSSSRFLFLHRFEPNYISFHSFSFLRPCLHFVIPDLSLVDLLSISQFIPLTPQIQTFPSPSTLLLSTTIYLTHFSFKSNDTITF